jgi:cation:H+ antiporter
LRGHDELGLGTLPGSNIFNGLWIVLVAAPIHPIQIDLVQAGTALVFGMAALLVAFPPRSGIIGRKHGAVMLTVYGAYITTVLLT